MRRQTAHGDRPTALCRHLGKLVQGLFSPKDTGGNPTSFFKSESHVTLGEGKRHQWANQAEAELGLYSHSPDWSIPRYLHLSRNSLCSPYSFFALIWNILL